MSGSSGRPTRWLVNMMRIEPSTYCSVEPESDPWLGSAALGAIVGCNVTCPARKSMPNNDMSATPGYNVRASVTAVVLPAVAANIPSGDDGTGTVVGIDNNAHDSLNGEMVATSGPIITRGGRFSKLRPQRITSSPCWIWLSGVDEPVTRGGGLGGPGPAVVGLSSTIAVCRVVIDAEAAAVVLLLCLWVSDVVEEWVGDHPVDVRVAAAGRRVELGGVTEGDTANV